MLGFLYDVHGNVPALDAVLADAEGVGRWAIGGDVVAWAPLGREVLDRLEALRPAVWIRGNWERWLAELPEQFPTAVPAVRAVAAGLGEETVARLHALPPTADLDGLLLAHGCPITDMESFWPEPSPEDERLLGGARERTVVFGHFHVQFQRPGPRGCELVNPGSVGLPFDGDPRAAWATWDGTSFELRRTAYDVERAAEAFRRHGGELGEVFARQATRAARD